MERSIDGVGWIIIGARAPQVLNNVVFDTFGKADAKRKTLKLKDAYIAEVCVPYGWGEERRQISSRKKPAVFKHKRRLTIP